MSFFKSIGRVFRGVGKIVSSPVVGLAGSVLGGVLGRRSERRAQDRTEAAQQRHDAMTFEQNQALQDRAFAFNERMSLDAFNRERQSALDFWNMQNEYNSPKAQMQRFKDAGLSPHLIYGQSNMGAPVSVPHQSVPQAAAAQMPYRQLPAKIASFNIFQALMSGYLDMKLKQAELKERETDTWLKRRAMDDQHLMAQYMLGKPYFAPHETYLSAFGVRAPTSLVNDVVSTVGNWFSSGSGSKPVPKSTQRKVSSVVDWAAKLGLLPARLGLKLFSRRFTKSIVPYGR